MKLQLIRHATLILQYAGVNILIDPMFREAGVNPPIAGSDNERRNPLVPMPVHTDSLFNPYAVIVTHLHQDHWDQAAADGLLKCVPVFCQPGDQSRLESAGFTGVTAVETSLAHNGVTLIRTSGQHGTGEIGRRMGQVSGFVLKSDSEPTVYVAGDTVWCEDVKHALDSRRPQVTVVNAGGARFQVGDPITMDADDVVRVCRYAPYTKVIAVHMDAINHCLITREDLHLRLAAERLLDQVAIPLDGEWVQPTTI